MASNTFKALTTATAITALAGLASAGTSPFTMVNGVSDPGIDVSLTVQASTTPGYDYDFVVTNASSLGIITGVYFELDWNNLIWGSGFDTGPANYNAGTQTPDLDDWSGSKASHTVGQRRVRTWAGRRYYDTYVDRIDDGIHPGQAQVFSFITDTQAVSLDDLEDVLGTPGHGVGIRVQDILSGDKYASGWGLVDPIDKLVSKTSFSQQFSDDGDGDDGDERNVTGAPTPTAALASLAMIGVLTMRRRRNNG